ncbi:MAG TPA: HEAT repeat domain-containing protein [Polyangiaceae bacterium]|nr:HEAT repeat domain-containing protein [Polyangiaceae bacterium]
MRLPHSVARWLTISVAAFSFGIASQWTVPLAHADEDSSVPAMVRKLEQGADFRMRVQAALELGKASAQKEMARTALEGGLDDANAAVRAACAAALRVLGDPRALPALQKARDDESAAVKAQIAGTIAALQDKAAGHSKAHGPSQVLVQLGHVRNGTSQQVGGLVEDFKNRSEARLSDLPGVELLPDEEDADATAKRRKEPVVMLTGHLRTLDEHEQGGEMEYAAEVEFIIHRMPGRSIQGKVSGTARVRSGMARLKDPKQQAELRRNVIEAAIDSAMKRASEALQAAVR